MGSGTMSRIIFLTLSLLTSVVTGQGPPRHLSGYWDTRFAPCGISGGIYSLHEGGLFYFGGGFYEDAAGVGYSTTAQGNAMRLPIVWDGKNWYSLGGGVSGKDFCAISRVIADDSDLYIVGDFTKAGSVTAHNIARWNKRTHQWFSVGGLISLGDDQQIQDIDLDSQSVFISGKFTINDTIAYVASLDRATHQWKLLCHQYNTSWLTSYPYMAILVAGGKLYCGGSFMFSEGTVAYTGLLGMDLQRREWFSLIDDSMEIIFPPNGYVEDLYEGTWSSIIVNGNFTIQNPDRTQVANLVSWDGNRWTELLPNTAVVTLPLYVTASDGVVYLCGSFSIPTEKRDTVRNAASWDGYAWNQELSDSNGVASITGGFISKIDGQVYVSHPQTGAEYYGHSFGRWNGRFLTPIDSGFCHGTSSEVECAYMEGDTLYAAGLFSFGGGVQLNRIGKWTGTAWEAFGGPFRFQYFGGFKAITKYRGEVYLGGDFGIFLGEDTVWGVIKWDGKNWVKPFGESGKTFEGWVHALEVASDTLFIAGDCLYADRVSMNLVAYWDGKELRQLGEGLISEWYGWSTKVHDLYYQNGTLYAGGNFIHSGTRTVNRLAKWDGGEWKPLGDEVKKGIGDSTWGGTVFSLSGTHDSLFIGGNFSSHSIGLPAGLVFYDGHSVTTELNRTQYSETWTSSVAYDNGKLFYFQNNTNAVVPVAPGCLIDGNVYQFGKPKARNLLTNNGITHIFPRNNNQVYFAGGVVYAGDRACSGLALWHSESEGIVIPSSPSDQIVFPNPASTTVNISVNADDAEQYVVRILDMLGRQVALFDKLTAIEERIAIDVSTLPTGVYRAQIEWTDLNSNQLFVVAR